MAYGRFIYFQHVEYYPSGGLGDVRADANTLEELAKELLKEEYITPADGYIFDCDKREELSTEEYEAFMSENRIWNFMRDDDASKTESNGNAS